MASLLKNIRYLLCIFIVFPGGHAVADEGFLHEGIVPVYLAVDGNVRWVVKIASITPKAYLICEAHTPEKCLNIDDGVLVSSEIAGYLPAAWWLFEPVGDGSMKIRNQSQQHLLLYQENGNTEAGTPDAESSAHWVRFVFNATGLRNADTAAILEVEENNRWILKKSCDLDAWRICEEAVPDKCLNLESGQLQSSTTAQNPLSALWYLEQSGPWHTTIRNALNSQDYLYHDGELQAGPVTAEQRNAQWSRFTQGAESLDYSSIAGSEYSGKAYPGRNIALLLDHGRHDARLLPRSVAMMDDVYEALVKAAGEEPTPSRSYNGLYTVAVVYEDDPCESVCVDTGKAAVDIHYTFFNALDEMTEDGGRLDPQLIEDLARNFSSYW